MVQTGWSKVFYDGFGNPHRTQVYAEVPDPMSKDCKYSIHYGADPKCAGCKWNQTEQK